jgi:hypothetical protein
MQEIRAKTSKIIVLFKKKKKKKPFFLARLWCLISAILATPKADIRRIAVQSQSCANSL